ncbi:hypothetical protein NHH88_23535 [Oxalobacteraceae bacterium OTU3CAMAD1]|nr:hypothetical protein NHH88_23535 [Oxalobacteraceae bacterium OTU3CAMAD1]
MNQPTKSGPDDHAADGGHMLDEADIGSGERSPSQRETDEAIKSIPPLPDDGEHDKPKQAPRP